MERELAEHLFKEADDLFRAGDPATALVRLDSLRTEFVAEKNVLYARARCLIALGRFDEAREVAEYMITVLGAPRGKRLLARIETAQTTGVTPPLSEMDAAPLPLPPMPKRQRTIPVPVRVAAMLVVGLGVFVPITLYVRSQFTPADVAAPATPEEMQQYRAASEQESRLIKYRQQAARIEAAKGPSRVPGQEIPAEEWHLAAIDGVPAWKPGIYRDVPCRGNGAYTIDVYVPMAYQERPEDRLPGLMISMPEGRPGFQGFKDYAEANDIIIVALNNSSNETFAYNEYAQELAFATILPSLRIDQQLGFTYGASGGARSNWDCMCRHPENFSGLLQVVFANGGECQRPPKGVRVAFLYAERDFNRGAAEGLAARMLAEGYDVWTQVYPGDHFTGPPKEMRIQMLDWLIGSARRDRGLPHPPP